MYSLTSLGNWSDSLASHVLNASLSIPRYFRWLRELLYMARNIQSSMKQPPPVSLCFECMTGCLLLSAETCVEQTPSSSASSFSDNVSSINIWGALKVSMSALHCPAPWGDLQAHRRVWFVCTWGGMSLMESCTGDLNWQSFQENYSSIKGIV